MCGIWSLSILAVLVSILWLHPGTQLHYISYLPGIHKLYFSKIIPYQEVEWLRKEVPSESINPELPNIVVIIADDLGFNDLSGGAGALTPHIDSIRHGGVSFTQSYAGHATCSPARASLLTGRYPNRFGYESLAVSALLSWTISRPNRSIPRQPVFHYDKLSQVPDDGDMMIPLTEVMISDVLRNASYSTVHIGKWHLGERRGMLPEDRYEEVVGFTEGAAMYAYPPDRPDIMNERLPDPLDGYLWVNLYDFVQHNGTGRFPINGEYMTDYLAKQAAAAIRTKLMPPTTPNKAVPPLFMTVAFNAPHTPLQAKKEDYDSPEFANLSHKEKVYAGMIKALDRGVGVIHDAIRDTGKEDNTLVIFTSDNGGPGYVGIPHLNSPFRGWKATFFEGGFRVPMYMRWPKVFDAGVEYHRPVSHVDIFSTVASAAQVDLTWLKNDRVVDGVDLVPYVHALNAPETAATGTDNSEFLKDPHESLFWRTGSYTAFRHGDWKLQATWLPDRVWLTDMIEDQVEKVNLADGLLWSVFKNILDVSSSHDSCVAALSAHVSANITTGNGHIKSNAVINRLCTIGDRMLAVTAEQAEPLWPALTEVPMPVDTATAVVANINDEYVYWAL
jgi:arylsulfatase A-like enzyme